MVMVFNSLQRFGTIGEALRAVQVRSPIE